MSDESCYLVRLDFERVQTYLFAVSELKSMIGANTKLGEVLRGRLANDGNGRRTFVRSLGRGPAPDNLPALAVACGARLPEGVALEPLGLPEAVPIGTGDWDDPRAAYQQGVLTRDGGHFTAVFPDGSSAGRFVREARKLVVEELPGLQVTCRAHRLLRRNGRWEYAALDASGRASTEAIVYRGEDVTNNPRCAWPLALPQFEICEVSQSEVAAQEITRFGQPERLSRSVQDKRAAADRFNRGESFDILGMLREAMLAEAGATGKDGPAQPTEFSEIARTGYIAVIAADGNAVGKQVERIAAHDENSDVFAKEAAVEAFFHRNRHRVRQAVCSAVQATFGRAIAETCRQDALPVPFRFLMLGGDDLLLLCDAAYGPRFLVEYARALSALGSDLTVGAGMAIVKAKFPFHRAHELAEQLTASAKRLFRLRGGQAACSTVDWLAISESWHDDLAAVRREQYRRVYRVERGGPPCTETLALSGKPYPILQGDAGNGGMSLERLCEIAEKAVVDGPARTQLNSLAERLSAGRLQAEWAVRALDNRALHALLRELHGSDVPYREVEAGPGKRTYLTHLLDVLELRELAQQRRALENETKR